jgi:hypothetical protein
MTYDCWLLCLFASSLLRVCDDIYSYYYNYEIIISIRTEQDYERVANLLTEPSSRRDNLAREELGRSKKICFVVVVGLSCMESRN